MQPREYQEACRRPNAFLRAGLEDTLCVVRIRAPELAPQIEHLLASPPIEKPEKHMGKEWTDFIRVTLGYADAEIIQDALTGEMCEFLDPKGEPTGMFLHYEGIADEWHHYMTWLEETEAEGAPKPDATE